VFGTRSGLDYCCEYLPCCTLDAGFNFGCISGKKYSRYVPLMLRFQQQTHLRIQNELFHLRGHPGAGQELLPSELVVVSTSSRLSPLHLAGAAVALPLSFLLEGQSLGDAQLGPYQSRLISEVKCSASRWESSSTIVSSFCWAAELLSL